MKRALWIAGGLGVLGLAALLLLERERAIPTEPAQVRSRAPTPLELLSSEPGEYPEPAVEPSARTALVDAPRRESDWDVLVRVLDHRGEPAADVRVWLRRPWNRSSGTFRLEARTGAQGWARFADYRPQREKAPGVRFSVHCGLPFLELEPRLLPRDRPPTDPIVLRLPPTGSIEVRVLETDGSPAPEGVSVTLERIGEDEDVAPLKAKNRRKERSLTNAAGSARFAFVPLGRRFEAHASVVFGKSEVQGPGPARAGETTLLTLGLGADLPLLGLRAIDERGEPITNSEIKLGLLWFKDGRRNGGYFWNKARTEADGIFRVGLPDQRHLERRAITVSTGRKNRRERYGWLEIPLGFPTGETHLGDVVLREPELLVTGRVVYPDGEAVEGASIRVVQSDGWGRTAAGYPKYRAGGEYAALGWVDGTRFVVNARAPRTTRIETRPVTVTVGQRDVELILPRAIRVTGELLLPAQIDRGASGHLVLESAGPPCTASIEEDGTFSILATTPGPARLELRAREGVLWEVDDLLVPEHGELADPRLNPLDLRRVLYVHELHLVAPEGGKVARGTISFRALGASEDTPWAVVTSQGDTVLLPSPFEAIDVRVQIGAYRGESLEGVRGASEVVLREPLRVRLVLHSEVPLPGWPGPLRAELWLDDRKVSRNRDNGWFSEARPEVALLAQLPGRLRVRWWQHHEGISHSGPRPVELGPPLTIDVQDVPGEQVFELTLPADAVRALTQPAQR